MATPRPRATLEQRVATAGRDGRSVTNVTIRADDAGRTPAEFTAWVLDHYALR
ncbi:hypothetical protein ACWEFJ_00460 [Actinosynnema sp. NPDC004786]